MKRLVTALAALGLTATGLAFGAGTAHAEGCSNYISSKYGAGFQVCFYNTAGTQYELRWAVTTYPSTSTDERFYVVLHSYCGDLYSINFDDFTQPQYNYGQQLFDPGCGRGGMWAEMWATESGVREPNYVTA